MTKIHESLEDSNLEYVWFDFHGECKKMKWENLSKLVAIVKNNMLGYGHFMAELDVSFGQRELISSQTCRITSTQQGVMRTNCMDCLDRTNVVQSVFARQIALLQLHSLGVSAAPQGQPFEEFRYKDLEQSFRNAWTDNADICSLLYTGTPALKTDFTRTGKRSKAGAMNDGWNSMTRYFINNFHDGYNCDCLDLSQCQITAKQKLNPRGFLSPLKLAFAALFTTLFLTSFVLNTHFPYEAEPADDSSNWFKTLILRSLIYTSVFMVGMLGIFSNGKHFIDDSSRLDL